MSELEIFSFPYGAYLKLRLEFVLLRDDDLQARIMRIIESWMIDQKKVWESAVAEAASQGLPEPEEPEYWCTLSYAQIIAQLYKFNTSRGSGKKDRPNGKEVIEGKNNTITRVTVANAMHALIEDKYVRVRPNPNPIKEYEATQYTLNIPLIQEHLAHLPKKPMSYLGSNGRINGVPCKDFLHPPEELNSELGHDPRKKTLRPTQKNLTSHVKDSHVGDVKNSYNLIDYVVIDSSLDKDNTTTDAIASSQQQPSLLEMNLSSLSEQEQSLYRKLRKQDQDIYLAWSPSKRSVYVNWLASYDNIMPLNITAAVIREVDAWDELQPTAEMFKAIRTYALEQEKNLTKDKQYYTNRGFKFWDARTEYQNWKSRVGMNEAKGKPVTGNQGYDEAMELVGTILNHTKLAGYADNSIKAQPVKQDDGYVVALTWYDGNYVGLMKSLEDWRITFIDNLIDDEKLPNAFDKEASWKDILYYAKVRHDAPTMEDLHAPVW